MAPLTQNLSVGKRARAAKVRARTSAINKYAIGLNDKQDPQLTSLINRSTECLTCHQEHPDSVAEYLMSSGNTGFSSPSSN